MNYKKGKDSIEVSHTDYALITHSFLNKGMGFSEKERDEFKLHGLIPPHIASIDEQRERSYLAFQSKISNLEKYTYLLDLQNSNETLFYNLVSHNIKEMIPIIYTPVVGEGCMRFSQIYRRPRGVFISYPNRHKIDEILSNTRFDATEIIVVSDGERILGLGDQGAGGMGIPIGKLSLYTVCAGIHPSETLPILLDTGTDNLTLINDPAYIGWRHERIRGKEYDDFIELFVSAVKRRFPNVLLQWEDFARCNAEPILSRYKDTLCSFNDDIQGTSAIAVGTLLSAINTSKIPLIDQRIIIVGGGSAGCGIGNLILEAMVQAGLSKKEAASRFYLIDRHGLLTEDSPDLLSFQKPFALKKNKIAGWACEKPETISLKDAIVNVKPTLLIGVSAQPGIFTEELIKEMASHVDRPIIFSLSNPTSKSEATPSDLIKWTNGKAIIGTGSPFPDVLKDGKPFRVDQTNNAYIFPGLGLGITAIGATRVTNRMFMAAATALANCSPAKKDPEANLLPPLTEIREISFQIALAVAKEAIASGDAPFRIEKEVEALIHAKMWDPIYIPYKKIC